MLKIKKYTVSVYFKFLIFIIYSFVFTACEVPLNNEKFSTIKAPELGVQNSSIDVYNMSAYEMNGTCLNEAGDVTILIKGESDLVETLNCVDNKFNQTFNLSPEYFYNGSLDVEATQLNHTIESASHTESQMIATWNIENPDLTVTFPLISGFNYNFSIDWGDGSPLSIVTSFDDLDAAHTYSEPGDYEITVTGLVEAWGTNAPGSSYPTGGCRITSVEQLGRNGWRSFRGGFNRCDQLVRFNADGEDFRDVISTEWMLKETIVSDIDVSNWNMSNNENMGGMFQENPNINPDVSNWDVSQVTNFWSMFFEARVANPDVSDWDMENALVIRSMFESALSATPDLSDWNLSKVRDMSYAFRNAPLANPDPSNWNLQDVTDMRGVFQGATDSLSNENYSNFLVMVSDSVQLSRALRIDAENHSYLPYAQSARDALVSNGWQINDQGPE